MKTISILAITMFFLRSFSAYGQMCGSYDYQQAEFNNNPSLKSSFNSIEQFINQRQQVAIMSRGEETVIKIPVVVHILYHTQDEKISDAQVQNQIDILNACFRRRNADSVNTPLRFKSVAADCGIEFQLATSDSRSRSTTGIIRKYTPIEKWKMDDKMKFSSSMGDDAWDPSSYLNIWICRLDKLAGYASFPGGEMNKDGLAIDFAALGTVGATSGYGMGKTAVHELGHWLGLKHLWGDEYCGDDGVADTPKQAGYTIGCPNNIRITCGNSPNGDMYMNYMDFTNDACTNMFTIGQKMRMKALFEPGGSRFSLLSSKGLTTPLIFEIPLQENDPKWLKPQLFPNPTSTTLTLDLTYDARWVGSTLQITNLTGLSMMQQKITSKVQQINVQNFPSGVYILAAKREDGLSIKLQFVKL
ncbi:MAG: T9SS type A sorting domain-containing protein [Bacteroidetes bacterium]|nr:T9SS type A sorting domain-containing protein [Bacteroidota bacterium]